MVQLQHKATDTALYLFALNIVLMSCTCTQLANSHPLIFGDWASLVVAAHFQVFSQTNCDLYSK